MNLKEKLGLLGATILTLGVASTPAMAQDNQEGAAEEDVIVVTGSRLRRETFDSPNPTVQVGQQALENRQIANTIDAIEDLPLVGIGSNSRGANAQFGDNFAFPNVLSVGSQRTLTILNGRRVVASNQGTVFVPGNASGAQVDLSMINPQVIDRVEVLTGTGGAIYGADAVAGVVNIITKDDYEGLDLRAQAGMTEIGDGEQMRIGALWGTNLLDDRLNITISADYFQQELITTSEENLVRYQGTPLAINVLDAGQRNPAAFNVSSAITTLNGGGALPAPFLASASNGFPNNFYGPIPIANPTVSRSGNLISRFAYNGGFSANTQLIPGGLQGAATAGCGFGPNSTPVFAVASIATCGTTAANVFTRFLTGADLAAANLMSPANQTALANQLLQRNLPTPYEYAAANPTLDPMLFLGLFGPGAFNGGFPTINNTNATPLPGLGYGLNTNVLFPRTGAPYYFDETGTLVPYNIGNFMPPLQGRVGQTYLNDGYDVTALGHAQLQAGSERFSLSSFARFDITDYMRLRQEILYTDYTFDSVALAQANTPGGSATAGTTAIPIYINQNPFLTAGNLATINSLRAQGWTTNGVNGGPFPLIGGQEVIYMGRALEELTGGATHSANEVNTYRIAEILEGEFDFLDRSFYWDVAGAYGRAESINKAQQVLDVEFALAVDVVDGPGVGIDPVCRQQTLGAPEPIGMRNPGLTSINTTLQQGAFGVTPTQQQIDDCVPLNLFGTGNVDQAAIDYILTDGGTSNLNTQVYYAASFGGEILQLPAGWLSVGLQGEYRRDTIAFEPGLTALLGLGRNTTIQPGDGELEFKEYGYEALLPVFGEGFQFPLMNLLEFHYAFRMVERTQSSNSPFFPVNGDGTTDDTFTYSFRWKPIEDLTVRGSRSRSVRSASLVELFGPPSTGFGGWGANTHPCTPSSITQGPNPSQRQANCIAAVQLLGYAANAAAAQTFLNTFQDVGVARPAAAVGNPFLQNEEGNAYSYGITWEPSFIPRLLIAADFFSVDVSGLVGLNGPPLTSNDCFDDPNFPNSDLNGTPSCDLFAFGVFDGASWRIPAVNPLTGNPIGAGAVAGQLAQVQNPFEVAFITFPNLNLGRLETRGVNLEVRYNFPLADVPFLGSAMENWGDIFWSTSMFQMQRQDTYGDNVTLTDRAAGEHALPEFKFANTIRHRIGAFDHAVQWFWTSGTVTNIQTSKANYPEQSQNFVADAFHYFNYTASYDVTDNMTLRLVVNNLTNELGPREAFGNPTNYDGGIGREFIVGVTARF